MNYRHLPSFISSTRLVFAGLIYYLVYYYFLGAAFILFLIGLLMDWLDGKVARALKAETQFGAFWDQFCDKILILVSLFAIRFNLAQLWSFFDWRFRHFLYVIVAIEVVLVFVRPVLLLFGRNIKAGIFGKIKLATQGCLVSVLFIAGILDTWLLDWLIISLLVFAIFFGVLSIFEKIIRLKPR